MVLEIFMGYGMRETAVRLSGREMIIPADRIGDNASTCTRAEPEDKRVHFISEQVK